MLKRADVNYVYDWFLSRDSLLSFHFEVRSIRSSINTSFLPNLLNVLYHFAEDLSDGL